MSKTKIVLSFNYRNHLDQTERFTLEFETIHNFRNYLRWEPLMAMAIRYGPVIEDKLKLARATDVTLSLRHNNQIIEFKDAHEFGMLIKTNKQIASALQMN